MSDDHIEISYLTRSGTIREHRYSNGRRVSTIRSSGDMTEFWKRSEEWRSKGFTVLTYIDQHATEV